MSEKRHGSDPQARRGPDTFKGEARAPYPVLRDQPQPGAPRPVPVAWQCDRYLNPRFPLSHAEKDGPCFTGCGSGLGMLGCRVNFSTVSGTLWTRQQQGAFPAREAVRGRAGDARVSPGTPNARPCAGAFGSLSPAKHADEKISK